MKAPIHCVVIMLLVCTYLRAATNLPVLTKAPSNRTSDSRTEANRVGANTGSEPSEKVSRFQDWQLWASVASGVILIGFLIYVFEKRKDLSPSQWALLRLICPIPTGIFAGLLTGQVFLQYQTEFLRISASAGAAVALLSYLLFPKYPKPLDKTNGILPAPSEPDKNGQDAESQRRGRATMTRIQKELLRRSRTRFNRSFPDLVNDHLGEYVAVGPDGLVAHAKTEADLKAKIPKEFDADSLFIKKIGLEIIDGFDFGGPVMFNIVDVPSR